jgi:pentatricopeptide repeat protein
MAAWCVFRVHQQTYGWVVHGLARDYRLEEAIEVLRVMKEQNIVAPERFLFLLRQRCKVRRRRAALSFVGTAPTLFVVGV